MSKPVFKTAMLFTGTAVFAAASLLSTAAAAQEHGYYEPSYQGYPQQDDQPQGEIQQQPYPQQQAYPQQGGPQQGGGPYQGQYQGQYGNQPDLPPPPGYDGTRPPPPPPGYNPGPAYAAQQQADARYAYEAQQWAHQYCRKSHGDAATGAIVGGLLGAIVGGGLSGRHDGGGGVFAGAAVGAAGGAVIAGSTGSDATSPGCPPGYVVRGGAPTYAYGAPNYYYAAPGWYRPWVFVDGDWAYRPYPYHEFYYHQYRGGWGNRGGYRGDHRGY